MERSSVGLIIAACLLVVLPTVLGIGNTLTERSATAAEFGGAGQRFLIDEFRPSDQPGAESRLAADQRVLLAGVRAQCWPGTQLPDQPSYSCQAEAVERAAALQGRPFASANNMDLALLRRRSGDHLFVELEDGSIYLFLAADAVFVTLIHPTLGLVLYRRAPFETAWTGTVHDVASLTEHEAGQR